MNYFENVNSADEAKKVYKELAKTYHPDLGGCVEIMKIINLQYEKVLTGVFEKAGKSITEIDNLIANDVILREKLNAVLSLEGIEIELCGTWLWITGETMAVKENIKLAGFFWAKQKKAWYWRSPEERSYNRKSFTIDEIRQKHGSAAIKSSKKYAIN